MNLVRFIPRVGDYLYAVEGNAVFVNLFAASQARIPVSGGELTLRQATTYPWDGRVTLAVVAAPTKAVDLRLRIPGWARSQRLPSDLDRYADDLKPTPSLLLNGKRLKYKLFKGYVRLHRRWRAGDVVTLNLEMPVRRVMANPKVQPLTNRIALERGPLVYCAEGADNNGRVLTRTLAGDATLTTQERPDLLGGIVTVNATTPSAISPPTTFIPYYAWCHRGTNEMLVWLPRPAR